MANAESVFNSIFGVLHTIFGGIRDLVTKMSADYASLILLAIAIVGGYYLNYKYPQWIGKMGKFVFVLYALIFFLLLKFV